MVMIAIKPSKTIMRGSKLAKKHEQGIVYSLQIS